MEGAIERLAEACQEAAPDWEWLTKQDTREFLSDQFFLLLRRLITERKRGTFGQMKCLKRRAKVETDKITALSDTKGETPRRWAIMVNPAVNEMLADPERGLIVCPPELAVALECFLADRANLVVALRGMRELNIGERCLQMNFAL